MTQKKRRIRIHANHRARPDARRLSRALLALAAAEAERAAQADEVARRDQKEGS